MTSARCGRCRDPGPGRVRGRGGCPGSPWRAPATTAARVMLLHLATCSDTSTVLLYSYKLFSEGIKILTTDYLHLHSTFQCKNIPYGQSSAKLVILSSCHPVILSSCHPAILSSCHPAILSSCYHVIMSSCHHVIMSLSHHVNFQVCLADT